MFKPRLSYAKVAPAALEAVMTVETYVRACGLEKRLIELVKLRASQINRCAFCIDMHAKDARRAGETPQRLDLLPAWHESPIYSDRERAALAWTESLTRLSDDGAPDQFFERLKDHFTDKEIVDLTVLVGLINLWNRFSVGFRLQHPAADHA
ncbi:MAG: carboxymuconolactone decarboxylase family protein [Hyphomicrobiaceae bacterium]|nr:MAG: carboxymuconolactone decarboxylase family protein [Hyphomicrobiaceae bacterium]